ncbi:right-handed parallel beta-helix repeat-containing protein [Candidatus Bathyarchaeota archaeon]|nr:right-handed parallel beta-helix repeat-containing protein [Candidatus Bathyarchaeota archaeon]
MNRQFKSLIIAFFIVSSIFGFRSWNFLSSASTTYVEGPITRDTVWTLVDSPYIISQDVVVYPNATLVIEPEVEVRFAENFSLTVQGVLVANGTVDRKIVFTSSKHIPSPGDWKGIKFQGTSPSTMRHCIVEYAIDGLVVENGLLEMQNCVVRLCSKNGVRILNSQATIENNVFLNNTEVGIEAEGFNNLVVRNNTLETNGDAIVITGDSASGITAEENSILRSIEAGIRLEATSLSAINILNNTLSENQYGFYVSTEDDTYITRNYITNNTVGIFYDRGLSHEAHFNDIFGNNVGMDAALSAHANATYNYWGHWSGPNHPSLNPYGKGNSIGGNGLNLDFIFFLSAPIDHDNVPPTAVLWTDKITVAPSKPVTFIGTDSYDEGRIDQYFFTFGDGNSSGWTTLSTYEHTYSTVGNYSATLRVKDDFGAETLGNSVTVYVRNYPSLEVTVTLSEYTVNYNENVSVTVHVSNGSSAVGNATVSLFSVKGGIVTPQTGLTNLSGFFTATLTAPNITDITNLKVIAKAVKTGYTDGSDHKYLKVLPPLTVEILSPSPIKSEQTAPVTVQVSCGLEPVSDASVTLMTDNGTLAPASGVTNINGSLQATYTAPQTLSQIDVTIMALAVKTGFAEGYGQKTIVVEPKILYVEVNVNPDTILSEAVSSVTVYVTTDTLPVKDVAVTIASNVGGNFSPAIAMTNVNGEAVFVFTAPQTTVELNAQITATATKSGYVTGEGSAMILVRPKILSVEVTITPQTTFSEATVNISAYVSYNGIAIPEANITIASDDGGNFSASSVVGDENGRATFTFTAAPVNESSTVTITTRASKSGYADGINVQQITVNPGVFNITVEASPKIVKSGESTVIIIYVASNGTRVSNAQVTVHATNGSFAVTNTTTDLNGRCSFVLTAPRTMVQLPVTVSVNVSKNGYIASWNHTMVTVTPEEAVQGDGGWSLLTMLLIAIPIVVVVVVAVLIKLKVIAISFGDEDEQS